MKEKIDLIAGCLLFGGLPHPQIEAVAAIAAPQSYGRGETIFFEGDKGNGFFLVAKGKVKIFKASFDGKEQILHIFGPGEPFGEVPVFHGQPFPANAVALVKSEVFFIPREEFIALVRTNPSLALNMLAMLAMRLRRFAAQIEALSLKEVPSRLADYLLYLREEQGSGDTVVLGISKGQLASLLGTIPETLSRIFSRMADDGLIRVAGGTIHLLDVERLAQH